MRQVEVTGILLAAVASVVVSGCGQDTCTESVALVDDAVNVSAEAACALTTREEEAHRTRSSVHDCAAACGKSVYNTCYLDDPTYSSKYAAANQRLPVDGGVAVCPGHVGTVKIRCQVSEEREVSSASGCTIAGRRPHGLLDEETVERSALGAYFARAAHLEATAVVAFQELAEELWLLGAPTGLVERCHVAAREEVNHAKLVGALAGRFGGAVPVVRRAPRMAIMRARAVLAAENMVEGVVRETFAAAVELHRACAAEDPEVRAVLSVVSQDEASHAQLSWDIALWLDEGLDAEERRTVAAAAARAVDGLRAELRSPAAEVTRLAGAPSAEAALALFGTLEKGLWRELTWLRDGHGHRAEAWPTSSADTTLVSRGGRATPC